MNFVPLLLFVCLFFYGALNYLDIHVFRIQAYAISTLIEQIFGVHGVQEMFLRPSFSCVNKLSFMN